MVCSVHHSTLLQCVVHNRLTVTVRDSVMFNVMVRKNSIMGHNCLSQSRRRSTTVASLLSSSSNSYLNTNTYSASASGWTTTTATTASSINQNNSIRHDGDCRRQKHQQQQQQRKSSSSSSSSSSSRYVFDPPTIPSLPVVVVKSFPQQQQQQAVVYSATPQDDDPRQQQRNDPSPKTEKEQQEQQQQHFPIHRIYCVGRNYEEHIREMERHTNNIDCNARGGDSSSSSSSTNSSTNNDVRERTPPVFFTKPVFGGVVVAPGSASSFTTDNNTNVNNNHNNNDDDDVNNNKSKNLIAQVKYPPATNNLHHEVELVVAIGKDAEENKLSPSINEKEAEVCHSSSYYIDPSESSSYIFGFGVGVDLTRRDLQSKSKQMGQPWDTAKYFDQSTPLGPISSVVIDVDGTGSIGTDNSSYVDNILQRLQSEPSIASAATTAMIQLSVNGQIKQRAPLGTMIWNVQEVISELSKYYQLKKGDLILTGTPSGVGPLSVGDHVVGQIIFEEEENDDDDDDGEKNDDDGRPQNQDTDRKVLPGRFYIEPVEFVIV